MTAVTTIVVNALKSASSATRNQQTIEALSRGEDVAFSALDLDSLDRFEVIMQVEEALDIELDDDEVQEQASIMALVAFIEERVSAR